MVYKIMKGALFMQALLTSSLLPAASLISFLAENIVLLIIIGLILICIFYIVFRLIKKKPRKENVITPVRDVLGNVPERVRELN